MLDKRNAAGPLQGREGAFWSGRRVFVTGHTGFKGGWLSAWLGELGAKVSGYALPPEGPSFFEAAGLAGRMDSTFGDIRDEAALGAALRRAEPELVFHLAAQPLVRRSYREPFETFEVNVMGTARVLDAARRLPSVKAVLVVTSDKCYRNVERPEGYLEDDPMGGRDPYSASKGAAELLVESWRRSFLEPAGIAAATARAGNVIGGGDWSEDRLVPDAVRAFAEGRPLVLRNPGSVRPWQHVLDPLAGYLELGRRLLEDGARWGGGWNFGPADEDAVETSRLAELLASAWGGRWEAAPRDPSAPHEAGLLRLSTEKARRELGWRPRLRLAEAVRATVDWYKLWHEGAQPSEMWEMTCRQIRRCSENKSLQPAA